MTGLSIGEVLALNWANVDFAIGQIRVTRGYYRGLMGSTKTKCSRRSVPLPEALRPILLRLREHMATPEELVFHTSMATPEELVFHTSKGTPYSDSNLLHRELKPAGRKLGIPLLNWHSLRRTHATLFQFAEVSLRGA